MRIRGVVGVKGILSERVDGNAEARRVLDLRYLSYASLGYI